MADGAIEKYQLAGLDDRQRGFNRLVEMRCEGELYVATLRYESLMIMGEGRRAAEAALREIIHRLQRRGYTQLRSQLSHRGGQYLGSQEPWIEYPDDAGPAQGFPRMPGWLKRVGACFRR